MTPMIMNWILVAIVALSMLIGLFRGAVATLTSTIVWAIAVGASILLNDILASYVAKLSFLAGAAPLICALVVLVGLLLLGHFITKIFNLLGDLTGIGGLSRLLGIIIGLVRGAICVLAVVFVLNLTILSTTLWWQGSQLVQAVTPWVQVMKQVLLTHSANLPYADQLQPQTPGQQQPQPQPQTPSANR